MIISKDFKKNTVPASEQVKKKLYRFEKTNAKLKILIFGNSITLHEPKPEIGWTFSHGMAASCPEYDYVHLLVNKIENQIGDISYYIINIGLWEMNFCDENLLEEYANLVDFNPDIIVFNFGENIPRPATKSLYGHLKRFFETMSPLGKFLVVCDDFWQDEYVDTMFKELTMAFKGQFVKISDLGNEDENKALGMTNHEGVNVHPGDLGMKRIADRIFAPIKDIYLEKLSK